MSDTHTTGLSCTSAVDLLQSEGSLPRVPSKREGGPPTALYTEGHPPPLYP